MKILTPQQSKDAREALGLSQRRVAADANVPRPMLSLFEQDRVTPHDDFLDRLASFYVEQGVELPEPSDEPDSTSNFDEPDPLELELGAGSRLIEGFVVPESVDDERAAAIVGELEVINAEIDGLLEKPVEFEPVAFGLTLASEPPSERSKEDQRRLLALMARAYCQVRSIQGREHILPCTAAVGEFGEGGDTGDQRGWLRQLLGDLFGFLDPDEDSDAPRERTDRNWAGRGRTRDRAEPIAALDDQA